MATRKIATKTATKTAAKAASKTPSKSAARQETKQQATAAAAPRKPRPVLREQAAAVRPASVSNSNLPSAAAHAPTGETRYRWVAHAAYLRAEKRGFAPGHAVEDWLAAEAEFLAAHGLSAD